MAYPLESTSGTALTSSPRFPEIEEAVLAHWKEHGTFARSVEARDPGQDGANEYVFYDGPPFANGLPHYGHLLTGYVKDVVPRYQTMRGRRVERRFGWDTHGLPAELEAMDQLGIKTKDEILELGIEAFNAKCRESVMRYTQEWEDYVTRQARWVDFEKDYKTLNVSFMESVLWAFKTLYDKGLVYEGFRVLPYCWNDETPLSNHELRMDDEVYQVRQDPAVTVGVRLLPGAAPDPVLDGALALVWTTTPWTLPANLAVMVGGDVEYVVVRAPLPGAGEDAEPQRYLIAKERLTAYRAELGTEPEVVGTYRGAELVDRSYVPPFGYYRGWERAHRLVVAEFVTTTDGTGLVHTAGAFGEDDKVVTDREGIEPVMPVGVDGAFLHPVDEYSGMLVFDANAPIQDHLRAATLNQLPRTAEHPDLLDQGSVSEGTVLLRRETYAHSYPHCWRCKQPLIYKAVSSWFVEVTAIKDDMLRTNEEITWVPGHVKHGQFGRWLENARDWSISRNRFWGSPIPVWRSDDPAYPRIDVYGSLEELERDFGELPRDRDGQVDLHRPFVDELTRPNPDDPRPAGQRSQMRRVEDVLDVWFDSGSMSYAQVHHPFENADWFEHHFPADFIVEYIGQTRGWFYTLHILATALFDRPAFRECVSHGIVLGNDGQKMSKSLKNYPDVREVFNRDGADAMRWFLMSSPILRGGNLVVTEQGIRDGVRQTMIPLWNAWYFFGLYANAAGYQARWSTASTHELDRYILAKTRDAVQAAEAAYDANEIAAACDTIREFVDVVTNWYIRRSRDRFWDPEIGPDGSCAALDTLYTVLEVLCRVAAPLLPLTTEEVWRGLTGGESVHLTDWPAAADLPADDELVASMDTVREVCSAALALRKAERLRVRLPLSSLTVATSHAAGLSDLAGIVRDEVNVREVVVLDLDDDEASSSAHAVEQRLTVNARAAGPRLGKDVQVAIRGSKSGDWSVAEDGTVTSGGLVLHEGEYTLETVVAEAGSGESRATAMLRGQGGGFVLLDTEVTEELRREGLARDLVRAVQGARKDAGLDITDRISLTVVGDDDVWQAANEHQKLVMDETLAVQFGAAGAGTPLPRPKAHGLGGGTDPDGGTQPRNTAYRTATELDGGRTVELMIIKVEAR